MNFESLNLHPTVMDGLRAVRYKVPTPFQEQALPPALAGQDIIGLAQNGTGKTAAFALPILQRLRADDNEGKRALVISPEQESSARVLASINQLGEETGLESIGIYEGVSVEKQMRAPRYRPAVIVASPGRLLDHLWKGSIKLMELEVLVIDEADRMFDMGFQPEIRNILEYIDHPHQTPLFSATMPDGISRFVKEALHDPVMIQPVSSPRSTSNPAARVRLGQYHKTLPRKNQSR